jgi:hypothetical protein
MRNLVVLLRRRLQLAKDIKFFNLETEVGENLVQENGFYLLLE